MSIIIESFTGSYTDEMEFKVDGKWMDINETKILEIVHGFNNGDYKLECDPLEMLQMAWTFANESADGWGAMWEIFDNFQDYPEGFVTDETTICCIDEQAYEHGTGTNSGEIYACDM